MLGGRGRSRPRLCVVQKAAKTNAGVVGQDVYEREEVVNVVRQNVV